MKFVLSKGLNEKAFSLKTSKSNSSTGFATGDPDADAMAVRYFVSRGLELVCAQSFAKSFGLYDERVGNLFFVANDCKFIAKIRAQLFTIIRANYLSPPKQGALIVKTILSNPALFAEWSVSFKKLKL